MQNSNEKEVKAMTGYNDTDKPIDINHLYPLKESTKAVDGEREQLKKLHLNSLYGVMGVEQVDELYKKFTRGEITLDEYVKEKLKQSEPLKFE